MKQKKTENGLGLKNWFGRRHFFTVDKHVLRVDGSKYRTNYMVSLEKWSFNRSSKTAVLVAVGRRLMICKYGNTLFPQKIAYLQKEKKIYINNRQCNIVKLVSSTVSCKPDKQLKRKKLRAQQARDSGTLIQVPRNQKRTEPFDASGNVCDRIPGDTREQFGTVNNMARSGPKKIYIFFFLVAIPIRSETYFLRPSPISSVLYRFILRCKPDPVRFTQRSGRNDPVHTKIRLAQSDQLRFQQRFDPNPVHSVNIGIQKV